MALRRPGDGPTAVALGFAAVILLLDALYVWRITEPDKWIVLGLAALAVYVPFHRFARDLVGIVKARRGGGDV